MNSIFLYCTMGLLLAGCTTTGPTAPSKEEKLGTIYFDGGTQALNEGKYSDALTDLLKASSYQPDSAPIWNNLGLAYAGKEDLTKAKECWQKALNIDSSFSDARSNLGALFLAQGKYESAEKELKLVLKDLTYQKLFQVYYNLALINLRQRKLLQAEQNFQLSVKNNKSYCPSWERLGYLEKDRGDYQAALDSWHKAVYGPCFSNPELHYNIASLFAHLHEKEKAKAKYLEIIQLFPTSDWAKKSEANLSLMR